VTRLAHKMSDSLSSFASVIIIRVRLLSRHGYFSVRDRQLLFDFFLFVPVGDCLELVLGLIATCSELISI